MASLSGELSFYAKKAMDEAPDMASDSTSPPSAAGRKWIDVDEFMKAAIRMQVRDIFSCKEIPTAQKVLDACRKNIPDLWQKVVTHVVDKVETACWKADALQEKMAEQPIILLGEADTSSDSEPSVVDGDDDY